MDYTLKGFLDLLEQEGVNSKELVIKALRNASSYELKGFRNDLNRVITAKTMSERKGK